MFILDPLVGGPIRVLIAVLQSVAITLTAVQDLDVRIPVALSILNAVVSGLAHFTSLGDVPEGE